MIDPIEICKARGWPFGIASDQKTLDDWLPEATWQGSMVVWLKDLAGPVDLSRYTAPMHAHWYAAGGYYETPNLLAGGIRWLIVSGGPEPLHPDWVRSLRDQCQAAGVPFYFMGWGEWVPSGQLNYKPFAFPMPDYYRVGSANSGRELDGRTWEEMP